MKYHFLDAKSSTSSTTDAASKYEAPSPAHPSGDGSTSVTDKQQCYGCGCGKCSLQKFLEGKCQKPMQTPSSFLYLNTEGLNESQQAILKGRLYCEFEKITSEFGYLVTGTLESLSQQGVTVKQLVRILLMLNAFHSTKPAKPLLNERIEDLNACGDFDAVLKILCDYISFFSHKIIDDVIKELGTPEDQKRLDEYIAKLDEYCKRGIFECPMYSAVRTDQANLVFKTDDITPKEYSMKHLDKFRSRISNIINVSQYTLRLCTVDKGCLQFTFQMPSFVKDIIFPLSDSQRAALRDEGVAYLTCGDYKCSIKVCSCNKSVMEPLYIIEILFEGFSDTIFQ